MEDEYLGKEYLLYEYEGRKGWTWGQAKKTKKGEKNKPQKSSRSRKENKLRKPSEISIQKDLQGRRAGTYEVTIDNKFFVTTTLTCSESIIREWIREVRAINGKRYTLLVGLSATSIGEHYAFNDPKEKRGEPRYSMLQLCVGSHCLLISDWYQLPRVLRDFLYDDQTIVCGVEIEKIAKKLEKENDGLIITRRRELRQEATDKYFSGDHLEKRKFEKCSLEELAREVFQGKLVVVKPKVIRWYKEYSCELSMEMIKYATVEAFLACRLGEKLLWDFEPSSLG